MAAALTDNFDSYSTGDLNGQGSWSGSTFWDVSTTVAASSPNSAKAAQTDESGQSIDKTVSNITSGTQRYRFYVTSAGQLDTDEIQVRFNEGAATLRFGVKVRYLTATSDCDAQTVGSSTTTEFTGITPNAWHIMDVEFDNTTDTFRIRVDEGSWSSSRSYFATATNINEIRMFSAVAAPMYIDSLGPATNAYTITADQGSYSLTGQTSTLQIAMRMLAAQGSYALTGIDAILRHGYKIIAAQGSYALSGISAALNSVRSMLAAQGSYTLTGQTASLKLGWKLLASYGSYVLTGIAIALRVNGSTALWTAVSKASAATLTLVSKASAATMTLLNKNSSTWTNQNKN